jgi:hypothetical protein
MSEANLTIMDPELADIVGDMDIKSRRRMAAKLARWAAEIYASVALMDQKSVPVRVSLRSLVSPSVGIQN